MIIEDIINIYTERGKEGALQHLKDSKPDDVNCTDQALTAALGRLIGRYQALNKNKSRAKQQESLVVFLESAFVYPTSTPRASNVKKDVFHPGHTCGHDMAAASLASELHSMEEELKQQTMKMKQHTQDMKQVTKMKKAVGETKKQLKRTKERESYLENKILKLEVKSSKEKHELGRNMEELQEEIIRLQALVDQGKVEIDDLKLNNEYLQTLLQDDRKSDIIETYDEERKTYSDKCKLCIYDLLDNGVTARKIPAVVDSVLSLVDKRANRMPARSTIVEMNLERLALAQKQLGDVFSQKDNTSLLTDETSKNGDKFMGFEGADEEGNMYVLGLRDIETKSAEDTLKVFKELLQDLDDAAKCADNSISNSVLQHLQCTMSDRAATEVKFNELLHKYRSEALPVIVTNWDDLTEQEQLCTENMYNFFCGLHSLVNLATTCQAALAEIEKGLFSDSDDGPPILEKSFLKDKEPGSTRVIRTACKAFAMGGDEKSGCFGAFNVHMKETLKEHKLHSLPIQPYRGSRFNILFANAGGVYFLHQHMVDFLENYSPRNRLLNAVLHDLKVTQYLAGAKALGLIGSLITSPLWCIIEDKSMHILDMNRHYSHLVQFLMEASENVESFMQGNLLPFPEKVRRDCVLETLLKPDSPEVDSCAQSMLSVLLSAMAATCKKLFTDHLPGGKWSNVSDDVDIRTKTKSVPTSSKYAESVFGSLDHLLRTKPSMTTISAEAYIMFSNNRTMDWLKAQDDRDIKLLLSDSKRQVKDIRRKFKERQQAIEEGKRKTLEEKLKKKEEAIKKKVERKEKKTSDILYHGLWQSKTEVDNMVASYTTITDKKAALKCQLEFRREVLHQVAQDKTVFNMSTKTAGGRRRMLTVEELTSNLKQLVHQAITQSEEQEDPTHLLVGKRVKHALITDSVKTFHSGKILSQV